ncbi:hypothetical protein FACS1894187_25170 [Synergistales bacterium]|nr:hypothetical protein FACS1894187_25170 [Synergistales bacterium]
MRKWKIGLYSHPDAIVEAPDYVKRLADAGVDLFIVRTGYGSSYNDSLEKAVQIIRALRVQICLLAGAFWGGKVIPLEHPPDKSNEIKWPMDMPGSVADAKIVSHIQRICERYTPESVCLTHARFRHPALIDDIFNECCQDLEYLARMEAAGVAGADVSSGRADFEHALEVSDEKTLLKISEKGLIHFLGELSQNDIFERFFSYRCRAVTDSLRQFSKAAKAFEGVTFGINAYSPTGAMVCGQNYNDYDDICDYLHPLLGYMEWHRFEPIAAWGRYLCLHVRLDETTAIEIAKRLFFLGDTVCPNRFAELDTCGEGGDQSVLSIVHAELKLCEEYAAKPYQIMPIIRGKSWSRSVIDRLIDAIGQSPFNAFVFQGPDYLLPIPRSIKWDW